MSFSRIYIACLALAFGPGFLCAEAPHLEPLMTQSDKVVVSSDFSQTEPLDEAVLSPRQGTRWEIIDGVLHGRESSAEFKKGASNHNGPDPRLWVPACPTEFQTRFSVQFTEGEVTNLGPFVEFGIHVARIRFSDKSGIEILAGSPAESVARAGDHLFQPGKWYHALAELKGDEFVVQFADGPTLYARHEAFRKKAYRGKPYKVVLGPRRGIAEIDDLTITRITAETKSGWEKRHQQIQKSATTNPTTKSAT